MDRPKLAVDNFNAGFNCAQSILTTYAPIFGLNRDVSLRIASGFGGGMGLMGETCGVVSGAMMVISLRFSSIDPMDLHAKETTYALIQAFMKEFRRRNNSLLCRDLLGCDISTTNGYRLAKDQGLFESLCPCFVREAALILDDLLEPKN